MMDIAAAKKGAEPGVPCQVCEGLHGEAKSWCADCVVLLCESCTAIHRKISATRDHELVPQYVMKAEGVDKFQRKRHCDKHKKCELKLYCESCKALVCAACTVIDHRPGKDHNPVEIATVAQKKKETLQELLQGIDSRLKEILVFMEEVDSEIAKLIPFKEAATEQAKAYFRRLADLLQKREQEILSQIDEQCQVDGKALQTKKEAIEFELIGLTRAQTFCQQAVEHGSDVYVLEVGNKVQTRVETLLAKQLDLKSDWSEFQFVENTAVADFAEEFKNLGGLSSDVDVSKCKVLVKPAVEGFRCVTVLTTMNKQSRPCVTHSKVVTANMKDPSGTNLPTQVQMKRGGMQEISYVPKVTGSHKLEVKVNSQQVGGSPFETTVQSRDTPVLTMGQKGSGVGELYSPVGVAVDKDGNIAVVEQRNKRVQIFDADTGHSLGSFPVEGEYPCGIDVDSDGRFLVTSWGEDCGVRRYSKAGKLLNTSKSDCIKHPLGITVLKDGRMAVADLVQKSCLLLTHDGSLIREIGKGHLRTPYFIAVDELRDIILVSDYSANKVFAFDFEGVFKFNLGGQGQYLEHPLGLALDRAGNIIVVNNGDGRLRVFGPDGTFIRTVVTMKGGGPFGLTLTPDGYIAGACYTGHCVEVYRYN
ncbi:E3 ubiquitin-protein ligase TRIM71-like [Branchiostoma floridae x Branchiostoma japonicum]